MKSWLYVITGSWVLISPWLLGFSNISIAKWSNVLCGLVFIVVNVWKVTERSVEK
jgi:hypothetical protein